VTLLQVEGLSHRFALTEVLAGIDLTLPVGESVALVGRSGCGKTTLLNLIAGLARPSAGQIENGFASMAYVFQQPRLLPWKSALDNIALGLKARGAARAEREHKARRWGLRLGLTDGDLSNFPHQLSGGMQSRVALARAWALAPDLLLLDEPFSALDVGLKAELHALLLDQIKARDVSLLMITHDLMEAVRLADRVLMMSPEPGRIVGEFHLDRPKQDRDEAWVYRTTAEFMQAPVVRAGFGLPPVIAASSPDAAQRNPLIPLRSILAPHADH
jgi:NitT/TauT family transport system ATP-binding protein